MNKKIPLLSVYLFLLNVCFYNCLPTSVLLDAGSQDVATKKVKRAPTGLDTKSESTLEQAIVPPASLESGKDKQMYTTQQKRGVSQKLLDEIQLANQMQNAESSAWDSDSLSINPSLVGNTDTDGSMMGFDYPSALNPYNVVEPYVLPYRSRNLGERRKRSMPKKLRLQKRDAKLSPTEILTLLSLVEQAQKHGKVDSDDYEPSSGYYNSPYVQYQGDDDGEWFDGPISEPTIQFYPMESSSYYQYNPYKDSYNKRFMVSKKKRAAYRYFPNNVNTDYLDHHYKYF